MKLQIQDFTPDIIRATDVTISPGLMRPIKLGVFRVNPGNAPRYSVCAGRVVIEEA